MIISIRNSGSKLQWEVRVSKCLPSSGFSCWVTLSCPSLLFLEPLPWIPALVYTLLMFCFGWREQTKSMGHYRYSTESFWATIRQWVQFTWMARLQEVCPRSSQNYVSTCKGFSQWGKKLRHSERWKSRCRARALWCPGPCFCHQTPGVLLSPSGLVHELMNPCSCLD